MSDSSHTPRSPRWKTWLKRIAWSGFWIFTLIALIVAFENWRGRRAWQRFVAERKAAGDNLEPSAVIPPPVAGAENFAVSLLFTPLLDYEPSAELGKPARWRNESEKDRLEKLDFLGPKPPGLGNWRAGQFTDLTAWQTHYRKLTNFPAAPQSQSAGADVLLALGKFEPELVQLRAAAQRPKSRFPVRYEDSFATLLPHLQLCRKLAQFTALRAQAELAANRPDEAFEDALLTLRLVEALETEPLLISQLIRIASLEHAMLPLWTGLVRPQWATWHHWTEAQLATFEKRLAGANFVASHQLALRGERNLGILPGLDLLRKDAAAYRAAIAGGSLSRFTPDAFFDHSKVVSARFLTEAIRGVDPVARRFDPRVPDDIERRIVELKRNFWVHPYSILAGLLIPTVSKTAERSAFAQSTVDLARVAIALERHRLKHGAYPATLEAIDAAFVPAGGIPRDVISGGPLHYAPTADGRFQLYAVGWNGKDDGGSVVWKDKAQTQVDFTQGDWVWPQPRE